MNLLIRNIPTETHQKIRERAKKNHRSLNQEILFLLDEISFQETEEERIQKRREHLLQVSKRIDDIRKQINVFATCEEIDHAKKERRV